MEHKPKTFGGALLVGGTAIGAGMLGLPIATANGGFLPAAMIYLVCWLFSICTGLLLLEAVMWMPRGANIISTARKLLGPWGRAVAWFLYLFLFYSLTIAYITAGGGVVKALFAGGIPFALSALIFTVIFASFVYVGTRAVDRFNKVLMAGLIISYFAFLATGYTAVDYSRLTRFHFGSALMALPIIFTSFSFQGLIPSLVSYFHHDAKPARRAIIYGASIPFVVYILWDILIKGIVPVDALLHARAEGWTAVQPLREYLGTSMVYGFGQALAFFTLTTSFLGVTLGLLDFLADGFKLHKRTHGSRLGLCLLVFIPPLVISIYNPDIFFLALNYAGGIGCVLLLGLLPVLMVWSGRYRLKLEGGERQLPGGKALLCLLVVFIVFELVITFI
ncbi:MAG: tyrosine transporter [Simkaniaceae bacterium]|nr:tyrosine transporter [Simkaniaceae bacterium]